MSGARAWWWMPALVLATSSCSSTQWQRVVEGRVVNGQGGKARVSGHVVTGIDEGELVVSSRGENSDEAEVVHAEGPATFEFYHTRLVQSPPPSTSSCAGSCCSLGICVPGAGTCKEGPHLVVYKSGEHLGVVGRVVAIDVSGMSAAQRAHIPVAYHLVIRNTSCGGATSILVTDVLPRQFRPEHVALVRGEGALVDFHDVAWDVRPAGARQALVVQLDATRRPLGQNEYVELKVAGHVSAPEAGE